MTDPALPAGRALRDEFFQRERDLLAQLAREGQKPRVLFVGCSDSRVIPEWLAGARPGDLFVVRNVANIIPPYGTAHVSMGAAIEFAVDRLRVEHLIVCGHTDCGGIKALSAQLDWNRDPHIIRWIEHARPARTRIEASNLPAEEQHLATVRENVLLQLENLRSYDPVREAERAGALELVGWVYHLDTGSVEAYDPPTGGWAPLIAGQ